MNIYNSEKGEKFPLQPYFGSSFEFIPTNFNHNGLVFGQSICFPFFISMPSLSEIQNDFNHSQIMDSGCMQNKVKFAYQQKKLESEITVDKAKRIQKKDGNTKANIIRDFINSLRKDAAPALLAKKALKVDYPLKKFMELLFKNFPTEEKYFRFKKLMDVCKSHEDAEFSHLLRTLLYNFLKEEYQMKILLKKKNKMEYLSACREMVQKLVQKQ